MINDNTGKYNDFLPVEADVLASAPFEFHLTGSNYFGCATSESDFDFIVQESDQVIEFLTEKGFTRVGGEEYDSGADGYTRGVYEKGNVCITRTILATHFAEQHRNANASQRTTMWRVFIYAAQEARYATMEPIAF